MRILFLDLPDNYTGGVKTFTKSILDIASSNIIHCYRKSPNLYFKFEDHEKLLNEFDSILLINKIQIDKVFINHLLGFPKLFIHHIFNLQVEKSTITHDFFNMIQIPQPRLKPTKGIIINARYDHD